jgi:hypothetical protein
MKPKILQDIIIIIIIIIIITLYITNLKFQHKPKCHHSFILLSSCRISNNNLFFLGGSLKEAFVVLF